MSRAVSRAANWSGAFLRRSGWRDPWRFISLLVLLSFLTAWAGTRAVMAGFEDTWTGIALTAARHENLALRTRQDTLRAQTEAALARLEAQGIAYTQTP